MNIQSDEELAKAYKFLEQGNCEEAKKVLERAILYDLESEEVKFVYYCGSYWNDSIKNLPNLTPFEQGESLISVWEQFSTNLQEIPHTYPKAVYSIQKGVFTLALNAYKSLEDEKNPFQKAEICRKEGLCSKKLGDYESALSYLMQANSLTPASAPVLAEMADCFALCGEEKKAKVLFREAFFIDAQKINIEFLDSKLIRSLIDRVREKEYSLGELKEWIPVYGVLYGVFNVKRELRSLEIGKLKQEIYAKENEIKDANSDEKLLVPKIINMYFWLIDYYARTDDSNNNIQRCLLKIQALDVGVYKMYTTGKS